MKIGLKSLMISFLCGVICSPQAYSEAQTDLLNKHALTTISRLLKRPELISTQRREIVLARHQHTNQQFDSEFSENFYFLVQGGLHGNEKLSSTFVLWLAQRFQRGLSALNRLPFRRITLDFLPTTNPDGARIGNRYNARGVNLNRNFDVLWGLSRENPGEKAFSEKETKSIEAMMTTFKYDAAVDIHGYIHWLVAPSSPLALPQPTDPGAERRWQTWLAIISKQLKNLPGYKLKTAAQLGDGGAFEDWAFWRHHVPAFCLEMSHRTRKTVLDGKSQDWFLLYERIIAQIFLDSVKQKAALGKS